jgi:predicted ATPase
MNKFNRDLLVLFKEELASPQAIEHEVEMLHELLYTVEKMDNLTVAHEVIDLNKFRINSGHALVTKTLGQKQMKPFIFLFNKN